MRFSEKIGKLYNGGFSNRAFADNRSAIAKTNLKSAKILAAHASGLFFALAAASLAFREISGLFWVYFLAMDFALVLFAFIVIYAPRHINRSLLLLYIGIGAVAASAIMMGTFFNSDGCAVAFIGVIAALPSQILDKPGRVAAFCVSLTFAFCLCSCLLKESSVALMDCINAVALMSVGIGIAYYNINTRMTSILSKAQLEWNESRYNAILKDSEDIVFELDPVTRSCYFGERGSGYFGDCMTFDTFINARIVHPEDRERYFEMLRRLLEYGENAGGEIRLINRDGEAVWFAMHIISLMDSDGRKKRVVGRLTNIDAQKRKEEILKFKSQIDVMTGLYNRAATEANITRALKICGNGCAMLLADMDNLKEINDSLGHAEGDEAIRRFAGVLKKHFSACGDIIGRTGGDEFMVFFSSSAGSDNLADILSRLFFELNSIRVGGDDGCKLSVSVGVAPCTETCKSFQRLYRMADAALYRVKKSRKNGYAFYDPTIDNPMASNGY